MTAQRVRAFCATLAVVVASLTIALLGLEIGLRLFDTETRTLFTKDGDLGHRYRPGFAGRQFIGEAGRSVDLRFNRLGFRGADHEEAKPAGTGRVAVLGDSFVASVGVDEADTMVVRLETALRGDRSGSDWEVLNFGVSGYSTAQSLLVWRHIARRFSPDVVILCFFIGNDPTDNSSRLSGYLRPYFHLGPAGELVKEPFSRARAGLNAWLDEHSRLYVWEKEKTRQLRGRFGSSDEDGGSDGSPRILGLYDTQPDPAMTEAWAITDALIATLAREVVATGARFVLATIPERAQILDASWARLLANVPPASAPRYERSHPDEMLAAIASSHGISLLSLTPRFRSAPHPEDLLLQGFHWSARGNELATQILHDHLVAQRLSSDPGGAEGHR